MNKCFLALLLGLAAAVSAFAQQFANEPPMNTGIPSVPRNITTTSSATLNNGINLTSGYLGALDNSAQVRVWGTNLQYGQNSCSDQFYKIFRHIRGFAVGGAVCATNPPGTTVSQFISGLFSIEDQAGNGIALIPQAIAEVSGTATWVTNPVALDAKLTAETDTGSISGTTLTVGGTVTGTFSIGDWLTGTGVPAGEFILAQLTGTSGGVGTYEIAFPGTVPTTVIDAHDGRLSHVTIQNEFDHFCLQPDTRCRNIIDGYFPNGNQANVEAIVLDGVITEGDVLNLTIKSPLLNGGNPYTVSYRTVKGDTLSSATLNFSAVIDGDTKLNTLGFIAKPVGVTIHLYYPVNNGSDGFTSPSFSTSVTGSKTATIKASLVSSGADQRFAISCTLFAQSARVGHWQDCLVSGNGAADYALVVGSTVFGNPSTTGNKSQSIRFDYTDNKTGRAQRYATIRADPTNAGSIGVDLVVNNLSGQPTNLSVPNGGLKSGGKNISDSHGNAVHQMMMARNGSVRANMTTFGCVLGNCTAATQRNAVWMQTNQSGTFTNMHVGIALAPGSGNNIHITLINGDSATSLSCTITGEETSCADTLHQASFRVGENVAWQFVSSSRATMTTLYPTIQFDNPVP